MISHNIKTFLLFFSLILISGCGGGDTISGGGGGGGDDAEEEAIQTGLASFTDRDITQAESDFCDALDDSATSSELAFGCFFSKLLLLSEGTTADTLLATFDETAFNLNATLLDDGGIFDNAEEVTIGSSNSWPLFNYTDFGLPFATVFASSTSFTETIAELLDTATANGVSSDELQGQVVDLNDDFEEFEGYLETVLADSTFTFDLPGELFHLDFDVTVSLNDARLMMSGVQSTIVALGIFSAYDIGLDMEDITVSGDIDQEVLVADLNGTGETVNGVVVDSVVFLTLDSASSITSQESRFTDALDNFQTALETLVAGADSEFFTTAFDSFNLQRGIDLAEELTDSMSGITSIDSVGASLLNLNLGEFFSDPPSAGDMDVGDGDPFVLEEGKATLVESYFDSFLDGIAEF